MLDFLCPVHLAAMLSDGESSQALERGREHEAATSAVSDKFVIDLFRMIAIRQVNRFMGIVA